MNPTEILARTIWGEARNQGAEGMQAVANTVMNRVVRGGWWGSTITGVCLKPWQFSCWNADDPNRAKLLSVTDADPQFAEALGIAQQAIDGDLQDITGGATSYKVSSLAWPTSWGEKIDPICEIGSQSFYNLE